MTTYTCESCKAPVTIVNGTPVRTCKCTAPIVASLRATVTGKGGVQ